MKKAKNTLKSTTPNAKKSNTWVYFGLGLMVALVAYFYVKNGSVVTGSEQSASKPIKEPKPRSECSAPKLYESAECMDTCTRNALQTVRFPGSIPPGTLYTNISCHHCPRYQGPNTLFSSVKEYFQGSVLDSGTGSASIRFLSNIEGIKVTAVTASKGMYDTVQSQLDPKMELVHGNWNDEELLQGQEFDTVLVDYLIGSMDAFSPYAQHLTFKRLNRHVKVGGRVLVIGWEPMPDQGISEGGQLLLDVIRAQNTCILMGNGKLYREFPRHLIEEYMAASDLKVEKSMSFPIVYGKLKLHRLLKSCDYYLKNVSGKYGNEMAMVMGKRVKELKERIDASDELEDGLCFGMDYAIVGQKL